MSFQRKATCFLSKVGAEGWVMKEVLKADTAAAAVPTHYLCQVLSCFAVSCESGKRKFEK